MTQNTPPGVPCQQEGDAACGAPARIGGKGVPLCQEHYDERRRAQVAERNARYAASRVVLNREQADALRDGIAELAEAVFESEDAHLAYETTGSPSDDDRVMIAREDAALAAGRVLRAWYAVLPDGLLPSGSDGRPDDGPVDDGPVDGSGADQDGAPS